MIAGQGRNSLLVAAALLAAVGFSIAVFVIPAAAAYALLQATPPQAVAAFWVVAGISLTLALSVLFAAVQGTLRSRWRVTAIVLLVLVALVVLLLALGLLDAAFAYWSHGPAMRTSSVVLFVCVAADLVAAALVIASTFLFGRSRRHDDASASGR